MYDLSKSFEVTDDGLFIEAGVGVISGDASPIGISMSSPCYYLRTNGEIWYYDTVNESWDLTIANVTTTVWNETGTTIPKQSVIYINGGHGNRPTVALAQANTEGTSSKTYGLVLEDISDQSLGTVLVSGAFIQADTDQYGATAGTALWLSPTTAGAMTITKPTAPNHLVYMGLIVRSHPTQGVIEVKIQNGYELDELHDVLITDLQNNQFLKYDSTSLVWKNVTPTKSDVGLANVDNTSDLDKPISTATQSALDLKADQTDLETLQTQVDAGDAIVDDILANTHEPTGYVDRTQSTIAWDDVTRTLTVAPVSGSFTIYTAGNKQVISATLTKQIPDTTGSYFFYIDSLGVLDYTTTFNTNLLRVYAYTSYVYWNADQDKAIVFGEERHGCVMDAVTHGYLHSTRGTQLNSGASISYAIGDGSLDADMQVGIGDARVSDEDITINITHAATPANPFEQVLFPTAKIPIFYQTGTGVWAKDTATDYPLKQGSVRAQYNLFSGGTWTTTDASADGKYLATFFFATTNIHEPIIGILGQTEYTDLADAEANASWANIVFNELPSQEMKLLHIVIYETSSAFANTPKAAIMAVKDVRFGTDREVSAYALNTAHSSLSGLLNDDHPQYFDIVRADDRFYTKTQVDAQIGVIDGKLGYPNFIFVNSKDDLPTAVAGVITLADNVTYFITTTIDLTGDRLVCGNNTVLIGGSSENCFLISTGLSASTALITSVYSLPMRNLSITHGTALNLDGTGNATAAIDWFGVNFTNCATVGTIKTYSNFIMSDCALLSSANMTFDGTIGTVGFQQCLFSGIAGQTTLNFPSTLTITRRIRAIYSSFVAFGGATAINVAVAAVIPVESYILDTINFSGGATYVSGVTHTDNKALFQNCKGISNSAEIAQMYFTNNTTQNNIATQNVFELIAGTTTAAAINSKFTHTTGRLTYTGGLTRNFAISAAASAYSVSTATVTILVRIAKNGTTLAESESQATTSAIQRNENFFSQTFVELAPNDFIEVYITNATNANNLLCTELNVMIRAVN
jgi:hypothetical protein